MKFCLLFNLRRHLIHLFPLNSYNSLTCFPVPNLFSVLLQKHTSHHYRSLCRTNPGLFKISSDMSSCSVFRYNHSPVTPNNSAFTIYLSYTIIKEINVASFRIYFCLLSTWIIYSSKEFFVPFYDSLLKIQ